MLRDQLFQERNSRNRHAPAEQAQNVEPKKLQKMIDEALKNMDNLNELQEKNRNDTTQIGRASCRERV